MKAANTEPARERELSLASPEYVREPECVFCDELLEQTSGVIAETAHWRILVSRDQGYLGRCMVINRHHRANITELEFGEWDDLLDVQSRLEQAVRRGLGASWCNWTQFGNDAFRVDEPKPHLHYHLRPRYQQPVEFAGYTFTDSEFGHMYDLEQRWNVDQEPGGAALKNQIAATIRAHLPTSYGYKT